jgi:dTDP-glucose 4,6-dehydratase
MATVNPLAADLDHVLAHTKGLWEPLRGQRIFVTGGTGFYGCWLLESFAHANDVLGLNASAMVLTRNFEAFKTKAPHLAAHPAIRFHTGDIQSFEFPAGRFSCVIHAATEASAKLNEEEPLVMFDTIVEGTRRVLEFARACSAVRFLLASSGAVYGPQPAELIRVPEDFTGGPLPTEPRHAYAEGKRAAEMLCALYARRYGLCPLIARGWAFVGPHLPLDVHFAIGNFIRDGLKGGRISINGDGTPFRSYLYAADLAIWLWTILLKGQPCRPYNVGSENDLQIGAVARLVAEAFQPRPEVRIASRSAANQARQAYVPSTERARRELGLAETISLRDSVNRTIAWHRLRVGG